MIHKYSLWATNIILGSVMAVLFITHSYALAQMYLGCSPSGSSANRIAVILGDLHRGLSKDAGADKRNAMEDFRWKEKFDLYSDERTMHGAIDGRSPAFLMTGDGATGASTHCVLAQATSYPSDEATFMRQAQAAYQAGDMRRYQQMLFEGVKRGYADAEANYGALLLAAPSTTKGARNQELACKLFARASTKGHAGAMYMLAQCFRHGWGVAPDQTQYRRWLVRSAEAGNPDARRACRDEGICK
jgi:hypothetical protein